MTTVLQDRMAQIETISLKKGDHEANDELQMCVMEAAAYVAGEPWSDHPQCACPVITGFLIAWNDALPSDAERDRLLKPLIPLIVGTRSTKDVEQRRSYLALDWLIRVHAPKWLDMLPALQVHAKTLRELDAIADMTSNVAASAAVKAAARAAAMATARDAAGDAAGDAAWDAAWAAALDATRAAAGDAARDAARDADGVAARDAAWDAAWAAAGDAAGADLKPTAQWLQTSAIQLVRDMVAIQPVKETK